MHHKDNYTLLEINGVFVTYDTYQQKCLFILQTKTNYHNDFYLLFLLLRRISKEENMHHKDTNSTQHD